MAIALLLCLGVVASCKLQLDVSNPLPTDKTVAPSFNLTSNTGTSVTLEELIKGGSAVLVFYRGYW